MTGSVLTANCRPISLTDVPLLTFVDFTEEVARLLSEDGELIACFADRPVADPDGAAEIFTVLGLPASGRLAVLRAILPPRFASLTPQWPQFHLFEREMAEQFGVVPEGHPWLKPVRFHRPWHGAATIRDRDARVGDMEFYRVEGEAVHEVAVGPVHAGVIEPGHFRFQCFGENVLHLEISLGYQHRGIEQQLFGGPHPRTAAMIETMAGDTTVGHMTAYCRAVEGLAGGAIPPAARMGRDVALELERLANHVGDIGALAGDVGFLPTAAYCGRLRGDYLNMTAAICGSRFGRGLVRPGGVLFGLDAEEIDNVRENLRRVADHTRGAVDLFFDTPSVLARLEEVGKVDMEEARHLGLTGVAARACGIDCDTRRRYPAGDDTTKDRPVIAAVIEESGDVRARALVRQREIEASLAFVESQWQPGPPAGALRQEVSDAAPESLVVSLVEGWRGRIAHVAVTDDRGRFRRYKVVDPSFFNWSGLAMALRNEQISDFPLCNKSFNLSYCGFDL